MKEIERLIELMLPQQQHFDAFAVGVVDFKRRSFECFGTQDVWFDLASVSKVLGNAAAYAVHPKALTAETRILLEHRAGLPAWGLLPNPGWQEIILAFKPQPAETLYSDYSAMRASLEFQHLTGMTVPAALKSVWDAELCFWRELPVHARTVKTGERGGRDICGEVHDPNAYVIEEWCGHAGLFATVGGVCRTLLNLHSKVDFIGQVSAALEGHKHRFILGWDRVENPSQTLAGVGCSARTFGHLGFTGTSVWIDADKQLAHVILSNATRDGWYLKEGLNEMRKAVGQLVWQARD